MDKAAHKQLGEGGGEETRDPLEAHQAFFAEWLDQAKTVLGDPAIRSLTIILPPATSEHDAWRRLYIGSATDVEIDSASRVLIPPELRRWAELDREVKFLGMGSSFELWDIQRYEAREATAIALGAPEALRSLVIR